ncbi:MAG: inositol monophosphatase family protein [Bacteroidota bacterium]
MDTSTLAHLCTQVENVAREAGLFLMQEIGRVNQDQIEEKSLNSLVSYVDRTAEEMIVADLTALLPEAGFLTEEETTNQDTNTPQRWIIDPLDGTTNFLFGLPCFSVSIALEVEKELVLGVVYEPNRQECFSAWAGGGAHLNGQPIKVRSNDQLAKSLLATGFPYYDYSRMEPYINLFRHLAKNTRGIRRWGSAAIDLAYTAAGRFDGFYEYSLNAWDVAAGIVLVREAGGIVTDFSGQNDSLNNGEIVAASAAIHDLLLAQVQQHIGV